MRQNWWYRSFLMAFLLIAALLWVNAGRSQVGADAQATKDVVARVYYNEISDIQKLMDYDVWEYNNLAEKYVLVGLSPAQYRQLAADGWRMEIAEEETAAMHNVSLLETFNGGYRTVAELYSQLNSINAANPTLTELIDYGDSYCKSVGGCTTPGGQSTAGHDLRAIRITNEAIPGTKPRFFLMTGIHAREITTPELAMRFIDWLIAGYNSNADARWLVDHHEIYIVPTVNPDGHWIVELGPYYQRKNANRSNGCANNWPPSSSTHYGIDLNRNHTFMWNTGGTSTNTCAQTYLGPSAGSEVETVALQNFVLTLFPDQRGPGINDAAPDNTTGIFMTMHSYGDLVLWPWGNTTNPAPNATGLVAIGNKFATYNGYQACQPSVCLYLTSGTSDDWAYGILGIPSYTFEVGSAFMPTYSTIDNVQWPGNRPALIYAAKIARTPYQTVRGPDALSVAAAPSGSNFNLTASINDSANGGQAVNAAEYYIDTPPWSGGTAIAMSASDGSFNSSVENVSAVINTGSLSPGQHIALVRGRDSANNWGPFSAVFFTVSGGPTPTPTNTPPPVTPTPTATPQPGDVFFDNFESSLGWTVNPNGTDSATTGLWERGNPEDTNSSGAKQLGTTFSGSNDLVTGRLAGASAGDHDIDGGVTTIRSPNITLPSSGTITLSFRYYMAHGTNSSSADYLRVYVVGNTTTQVFQELGAANDDDAAWALHTVSISGYAGQTIYLRIEASDVSTASLVEAAIDDVRITAQ
jgi:carboxypeptidase T